MDSGREQNYWPAFVDALSNVVLTLIFVIVIFVFALVMASNKVEEQVKQNEEQKNSSKDQENTELKKQVAVLTAQVTKMQSQSQASDEQKVGAKDAQAVSTENQDKQIAIENKDQEKANQGSVQVNSASNRVVLGFPLSVAEMDQKSAEQLGHVLDAVEKSMGKHKVIMRSYIGRETYSAAQRLAYYRAVGARNYLITKFGETPADISISIVNPPQPEDGRVEIIFQKQ